MDNFNHAAFKKWLMSQAEDNSKTMGSMKRALEYVIDRHLTVRQSEILKEYYYKNKNMDEIAFEFGLNKSTVSRHIKSGKEKIQNYLNVFFIH